MKILVSACLLGVCCRYDGSGGSCAPLKSLKEKHQLIPVCPEVYGGLPTPRPPAEISGGRVKTREGADVTEAYERGAREALRLARYFGCRAAILKGRSPACGYGWIHDGGFAGGMTEGNGVMAELLAKEGIRVIEDTRTQEILELAGEEAAEEETAKEEASGSKTK